MRSVDVIDTGTANLASILAGLRRVGARPLVTTDWRRIDRAARVVLPGVGAFGAGMGRLRALGLVEVLGDRLQAGRPLLAVCLGLQLLTEGSEESPREKGLGVVPGVAERFAGPVRVPQIGFNTVVPEPDCRLVQPGHAYFANAYRLARLPAGWSGAFSDHGGPFVAALERGAVLACQFHPELSGRWGMALLTRWLAAGDGQLPLLVGGVPC